MVRDRSWQRRDWLEPCGARRARPRRALDLRLASRADDRAKRLPDRGGGVLAGRVLREVRRPGNLIVRGGPVRLTIGSRFPLSRPEGFMGMAALGYLRFWGASLGRGGGV